MIFFFVCRLGRRTDRSISNIENIDANRNPDEKGALVCKREKKCAGISEKMICERQRELKRAREKD